MLEPPQRIRHEFVEAGWTPTRFIPVPTYVPQDHPAAQVLAQFSGLTVGKAQAGQECATTDLSFRPSPPDGNDNEIATWQELLQTRLISIADVTHGHGELFVDETFRFFYFEGGSFAHAMENLLIGIRARPMLRPDQATVTLYGIKYTSESPELYRY